MQPRVLLVAGLLVLLACARKQLVGSGLGAARGQLSVCRTLGRWLGDAGPWRVPRGPLEADLPHSAPLSSQRLSRPRTPPFWTKCRTM